MFSVCSSAFTAVSRREVRLSARQKSEWDGISRAELGRSSTRREAGFPKCVAFVDVWEANGRRRWRLSLRYAAVDDAANVALLALWNDPVFWSMSVVTPVVPVERYL